MADAEASVSSTNARPEAAPDRYLVSLLEDEVYVCRCPGLVQAAGDKPPACGS